MRKVQICMIIVLLCAMVSLPLTAQEQAVPAKLYLPMALANASFVNVTDATLLATVDTSAWPDISSDPAGIFQFPATADVSLQISGTNTLVPLRNNYVVVDPEVEEANNNRHVTAFIMDEAGNQLAGWPEVLDRTDEDTDVVVVKGGKCIIVSTDTTIGRLDQICAGGDNVYQTNDDVFLRVRLTWTDLDAEGLAYNPQTHILYLIGGDKRVVAAITLGDNDQLDATDQPLGDQFKTDSIEQFDPEGGSVCMKPSGPTLLILSNDGDANYVSEVTPTGVFIRKINLTGVTPIAKGGIFCQVRTTHKSFSGLQIAGLTTARIIHTATQTRMMGSSISSARP